MIAGSLFTGLSLFDIGVHRAFGRCQLAWFAEHDPDDARRSAYCCSVVRRRHPGTRALGDVALIDGACLGRVDLLVAGPPCQDISLAGRRRGLAGPRSGLWRHLPRILGQMTRDQRPTTICIENVPGLVSDGLATVLRDLDRLGYCAGWQVAGAVGVGAPHRRERCAIVARRDGLVPRWPDLAAWADRWLATWWRPDREPQPRTVTPFSDPALVAWRIDAVGALGNGVVVPWAEWVGAAARDAQRPSLEELLAPRVAWTDRLPPAGLLWRGRLYEAPRVYNRGRAEARVLRAPYARLVGRLLPTPRRSDYRSGATSRQTSTRNSRPLCEVARLLATPTRKGLDNKRGLTSRSGDGLATQARMLAGNPLATLLDPVWVAWLMGAGAEAVPPPASWRPRARVRAPSSRLTCRDEQIPLVGYR